MHKFNAKLKLNYLVRLYDHIAKQYKVEMTKILRT